MLDSAYQQQLNVDGEVLMRATGVEGGSQRLWRSFSVDMLNHLHEFSKDLIKKKKKNIL